MKKYSIINFLIIISLFFSCQENKKEINYDGYTINGITSFDKNKAIYLVNQENTIVDSSAIVKKSFYFKGEISTPSNYYFKFKNSSEKYPIILENENFIVGINKDETHILGGNLNASFRELNLNTSKLDKEKITVLNDFILENYTSKDLQKKISLIDEKKKNRTLAFIKENTNNLLSTKVLSETKNIALEELLEIQSSLKDVKNNSFDIALNSRILELQKITEEKLAREKAALALKKAYRKPAIMFSGEGLDNNDVSLKEILKGKKAVLIDFWASWFGTFIIITPSIKSLNTKYKDN
jgi:hypothetical protein